MPFMTLPRWFLPAALLGLALAQASALADPPDKPAPADDPAMPIDLPTAMRLVDASNPTIALARERVREAYARLEQAQVLWLPNLTAGTAYLRHDGQVQNAAGIVFTTSKSSIFVGGGAAMRFDTADAYFGPLVARRLVQAQSAASRATADDVQLEAALAYLELLRVFGALAINADTLGRAEELLHAARAADEEGLAKSKADLPRALTEVNLRRQERIVLEGEAAVASARLAQLLLLPPAVDLRPADPAVLPITLVPPGTPLDELIATGLMNRPELAEGRALVGAAVARLRQAKVGPFLPRVEVGYTAGGFGGGRNSFIGDFDGRGDGTAQATWQFDNLGFGDAARVRERRVEVSEANLHVAEAQARVGAEVTAAAKVAATRLRTLDLAQATVRDALEAWRRLREVAFGVGNPKLRAFEALEPLIAEQQLAQARTQYLNEVIEYNRAQFRLYWALGQPPACALPQAAEVPVQVPASPPPYQPPQPRPVGK